jgi:hypothetical protein
MLTAARPLSDPRILSIFARLKEGAQQDDSKMIRVLPRPTRLFAQPLVGEVRGATAVDLMIVLGGVKHSDLARARGSPRR